MWRSFFSLDFSADLQNYSDSANAVLLRAFVHESGISGKGIAKSAMIMLPDFVKTFPLRLRKLYLV